MRGDGLLEIGDTNNINNYHIGHKCIYRNIVSTDIGHFWCECNFVIYGSTLFPMSCITTLVGMEA